MYAKTAQKDIDLSHNLTLFLFLIPVQIGFNRKLELQLCYISYFFYDHSR